MKNIWHCLIAKMFISPNIYLPPAALRRCAAAAACRHDRRDGAGERAAGHPRARGPGQGHRGRGGQEDKDWIWHQNRTTGLLFWHFSPGTPMSKCKKYRVPNRLYKFCLLLTILSKLKTKLKNPNLQFVFPGAIKVWWGFFWERVSERNLLVNYCNSKQQVVMSRLQIWCCLPAPARILFCMLGARRTGEWSFDESTLLKNKLIVWAKMKKMI